MVALAVALPGSITASATAGMLPSGAVSSPVDVLEGMLPIQDDAALSGFLDPEHLEAVPVGASIVAEPVRAVLESTEIIETLGEGGIPSVAVDAYMQAADRLAVDDPTCGIRWTLLAAIGRVESNHGRFGGALLRDDGYGTRPIRGIPLDGRPNVALIGDTDRGELDGDTTYDRAVGPMQFIPSTWRSVGVDANGDGKRDPNNIFDAAQGAAAYLCRGDADLRDPGRGARRSAGTTTPTRTSGWCSTWPRCTSRARSIACHRSACLPASPRAGRGRHPPRRRPRPIRRRRWRRDGRRRPHPTGRTAAVRRLRGHRPPPPTTSPQPSPPTAQPTPATPAPPAPPPTSVPPAPVPSTTSTTVVEPPPVTTPDDTVPPDEPEEPPVDTPDAPVPSEPDPPVVDQPAEPPAAVGWAPAMREVVVEIIEQAPAAPAPAAPAPAPPRAAAGRPRCRPSGRVPARRGEPCLPFEPGTGSGDAASGRALRRAARRRVTGAGPPAPRRPAHGGTLGGRADGRALRREARPSTGESAISAGRGRGRRPRS